MSDINFSKLTWENLPARTTALSATNLNRIEKGIDDSVNGVNANSHSIAELQTRISQIANGSPTPVATVAEMTDESAVYLYTGSETGYTAGNWYFWNGSAWTSGGTYGGVVTDTTLSVSGAAADAKAVGDALAEKADDITAVEGDIDETNERLGELKSAINAQNLNSFNIAKRIDIANGSAAWEGHPNYVCTDFIPVEFKKGIKLNVLRVPTTGYKYKYNLTAYNESYTVISEVDNALTTYVCPNSSIKYIKFEFTEVEIADETNVNPIRITDFDKNDVTLESSVWDSIEVLEELNEEFNGLVTPVIEQGTINNSGNINYVRTKDYVPVKPNSEFGVNFGFDLTNKSIKWGYYFYDENKTLLSYKEPPIDYSNVNIPNNVYYVRFTFAIYNNATSSYLTTLFFNVSALSIICYCLDIRLDGILKHNDASSDVICSLQNGTIPNAGNANAVCTSTYIPVTYGDVVELSVYKSLSTGNYYSIAPYWYDKDKNVISGVDLGPSVIIPRKYIDSSNIKYIRFSILEYNSGGTAVARRVNDYAFGDVVAVISHNNENNFDAIGYDWKSASDGFNSLLASSGESDNYSFFTDQHVLGTNGTYDYGSAMTYLNKMAKVVDSTPCQFVISGGDWLNNGDTPSQATAKLGTFTGICNKLFKKYYSMVGNHDTNAQGSTPLTENAIINSMMQNEPKAYYRFSGKHGKYYVFDSGNDDGGAISSYRLEQLKWFAEEIKADNPSHGVIAVHIVYDNYSQSQTPTSFVAKVAEIASAFNNASSIVLDGITFDFSNNTGKVDYMIGGHTHMDLTDEFSDIPCVLTKNFTALSSTKNPTFDIVNADYTNGVVTFYRVGDGTTRTISI